MGRLYSVSTYWPSGIPRADDVEEVLNRTGADWIRFSGSQWFVWSEDSLFGLSTALKAKFSRNDQLVVVGVEPDAANGFASPWVWRWLNERMNQQLEFQFQDDDEA